MRSRAKITKLERKAQSFFSQTIELNTFQEEVKGYYQCVAVSVAGEGASKEIQVNTTEGKI
ncbi:hypothetical protein MHBO_004721 [Bonamia ostreae]|uniref:Uncharacterized protein n=1 Tax=Bonamia ostreae TaxID=126728 RepID=A0ABV2AU21_9EUKA